MAQAYDHAELVTLPSTRLQSGACHWRIGPFRIDDDRRCGSILRKRIRRRRSHRDTEQAGGEKIKFRGSFQGNVPCPLLVYDGREL